MHICKNPRPGKEGDKHSVITRQGQEQIEVQLVVSSGEVRHPPIFGPVA